MTTTKTQQLLHKIISHINMLDIAGYLKEEVAASLKYLHWYKLKNIEKNLDIFSEYLEYLNLQNTDKISKLGDKEHSQTKKKYEYDLGYFLASGPLSAKEEQEYLKKIHDHGYELLTLTQGFKGILVLSIDEFCNASKTRIDIHQLLMGKEPEYQTLCKKKGKKI